MEGFNAGPVTSWNNRFNRASDARSAARARVEGLIPASVITGATRGIGLEFARVFRRYGHDVVLIARSVDELATADQALSSIPGQGRVFTLACDVAADNAVQQIDDGLARFGCYLDTLVNNAAIGLSGGFENYAPDELDRLVAVNVAALTRLTRHALPGMLARGNGGVLPGPHQAAYYASKAYVVSLTEALASEISGRGVRMSVVVPGPVATRFHADMGAEQARYRILIPEIKAERVAMSGYRGFTLGKRVIVPGLINRGLYAALRFLPHPLSVPLTGWLLENPK
jgi:short-subunit dehydrogenase